LSLDSLLQNSEVQILSSTTHEYKSLVSSKSSAFAFRNSHFCFVAFAPLYVNVFLYCVFERDLGTVFFFPVALRPDSGSWLPITKASRSHSLDTPHSVGLFWTSDQPYAETSALQHTILTREKHPCRQRDSNPKSQQQSGRRPTPQTGKRYCFTALYTRHKSRFSGYQFYYVIRDLLGLVYGRESLLARILRRFP
jgi:hypothetical protein